MPGELGKFIMEGTPADIVERYARLPQIAEERDFGEMDRNIIVIDTETTGVSDKKDELTQIAAARLERGKIVDWFVTFVNPGIQIPDDIIHLTGITNEDVADAPEPNEALEQLVEFVGDAKLVAHNAAFDRTFTTKHAAGYPLLENVWIDSLDLARIALPRMKSHRLLDLVKAFGAPLSTHRADEDVAATCALYRILLAGIDSMPLALVHKIAELTTPNVWSTAKVFSYFAIAGRQKYAQEHGLSFDEVHPETFSLRTIRRDRTSKISAKPRRDAANMISAELVKKASIRIKAFGSSGTNADEASSENDAGSRMEGSHACECEVLSGEAQKPHETGSAGGSGGSSAEGSTGAPGNAPVEIVFPSEFDIEDAFSKDGIVGDMYPNFEARIEQLEMAQAVRNAFAMSENLVVEAGTGVGKSMAYLIPAAYIAHNNNITIGVATKTNALLDQLIYKELPALNEALDSTLTFAALKGFTHYPCLRKIQKMADEGAQMRMVQNEKKTQAPAIASLLSFIEQTEYGDIDALKIDFRTVPRWSITTTSHECLKRKCPFYGTNCFVHGQRRLAETSDIVVTNHSLLFCDVAADGGLLPPIRYWVVDEAHGAENEARRALSLEVQMDELAQLASRVGHIATTRNVFVRAERQVVAPSESEWKQKLATGSSGASAIKSMVEQSLSLEQVDLEDPGTLFYALTSRAKTAGREFEQAVEDFSAQFNELLYFDSQKKSGYDKFDLWINEEVRKSTVWAALTAFAQDLISRSEKLIARCQDLVIFLEDMENSAVVQREIAVVALTLKDVVDALNVIFVSPSDMYVYAAELSRKMAKQKKKSQKADMFTPVLSDEGGSDESGATGDALGEGEAKKELVLPAIMTNRNKISAMLYNVGAELDSTLYSYTRSIVFTSATISVNGSFDSFEQSMGLNTSDQSQASELMLKSSYDFDSNMKVYVISDMAEPGTPTYLDELKQLLVDVHRAQNGSMLTLFTNKKEMENCYSFVNSELKQDDLRLVCQRWGVSVKGLRDEFIEDETLSLFATKSFWEGFDAPGSTLRGVTIPKLPFAKPDDPLSLERSSRDDFAWRHYVLPQAVLEVKQAAGRLIRRADDTGSLILADSRLVSKRKNYGNVFLRSLPSQNISFVTREELLERLS